MVHVDHDSHIKFNFEGQFLGFVNHDGKIKYMRLRVLSEDFQIKIPKAMQVTGELAFQPGESLQVTGIGKLDRHTHQLKLKAAQIVLLTEHSTPLRSATPSSSISAMTHDSQTKPKIKSNIRVLVCQKSGCLKRGGQGLCEALEQALRDRHLNQHVTIERAGCLKRCSSAPNLVIMPGHQRYSNVRLKSLPQIVEAIVLSEMKADTRCL
jgi:(2Fe-2S) ferredoxin